MSIITPDTSLTVEDAVAQLQDADISKRYYAAWYLGFLQDPKAIDGLVIALGDESDRTELGGYPLRRKAAESLGRIGDRQAVPALIQALECEDLFVRETVAWALSRIGDPSAAPALLALLAGVGKQPYEVLIETLGDLRATDAVPLIRPYLQDSSERLRCAAARSLFQLTRDASCIDLLIASLHSADINMRRAALFDLAETGHLPIASVIAEAELTANLKLFALKQLVDSAPADACLDPVLQLIDVLL
jgi:phycocyanobilin lyase subunit alpha